MTTAVRTAIISGLLLIVWSVVTYFISGGASLTAFIPAGFGLLIALFGAIGIKEGARKHAMHGAALVGLLGLLGGFGMGVRKVLTDPGLAAYSQLFLGVPPGGRVKGLHSHASAGSSAGRLHSLWGLHSLRSSAGSLGLALPSVVRRLARSRGVGNVRQFACILL